MRDWNVVVTARDEGFRRACELLSREGSLARTRFYNVLVMRVSDLDGFCAWLSREWDGSLHLSVVLSHVRPARATFDFQSADEFERAAEDLLLELLPALVGKSFHVRVHRWGFKGLLSATEEERKVADTVLKHLAAGGSPSRITFEDPDAILAIDTVGGRAGMTLWSREEREWYPFLELD
jgi:hypothetical protein